MRRRTWPLALILSALVAPTSIADPPRPSFRLDFGAGEPAPGSRRITPATLYSKDGPGFDLGSKVTVAPGGDSCTSDRPFFVSVDIPEGNYRVTVTLGDRTEPSETNVKAESRRLMLERVRTGAGQHARETFAVNVRTPRIASGGEVRLKAREKGVLHWDDKLTLEFDGPRAHLQSLEIEPADDVVTVFLMGDSTVTDQPAEPWNSWGQMLPRFFGPGVAVANHAESGESLRSSAGARRLEKVYESIRSGDYLLVQYGHNDQKERGPGVGAFTTYRADLRVVVAESRKRGARPVLVTSMQRKRFDPSGKVVATLGDYPEAVRQVAREEGVPLIDLNAMSATLYEALGPSKIDPAFVDGTHHTDYGSYELSRCVVEGIRRQVPGLARLLRDVPPFDPAHPDPVEEFRVPPSPARDAARPDGN